MDTKESAREDPITRRGFLEFASTALLSAGLAVKANAEIGAAHPQTAAL